MKSKIFLFGEKKIIFIAPQEGSRDFSPQGREVLDSEIEALPVAPVEKASYQEGTIESATELTRDYGAVESQHQAISDGLKRNHPAVFPDNEIADNLSEKDFDSIFSSLTMAKLINLQNSYDSKDPQKNYNFVNKELLGSLATEADIIALQKYLKVTPDGKIGPKTLNAMQNKWLLLNGENISKPETVAYGLANFYSLGVNYLNTIFGKTLPEPLQSNFSDLYDYMGQVNSNSDFSEVVNMFNIKFKEAFNKVDPNNKEELSAKISAVDLKLIENDLFKKIHFKIQKQ